MKYISESVHEIDHDIILHFCLFKKGCLCPTYQSIAKSGLPRNLCGKVNWSSRHDHNFLTGTLNNKKKKKKKNNCTFTEVSQQKQNNRDLALRKIHTIYVVRILIELAKLTLCLLTHSADTQ